MTTDADLDRVIGNLFLSFALRPVTPVEDEVPDEVLGGQAWPINQTTGD